MTSAFRRAPRVPFRTDEKEPKVRLRTLRRVLRNLREYLASTRRLPPLPTGTQAEGSIQVADAPNDRSRMARRGHTAENNARSGRSRALRACAASPRSFPPPRGRCAPRKSGRASPGVLPVRFRRLAGRGIAPAARRVAGYCTPVRSSVAGRRRLWPQANRRRRGGQGGAALVPFFGSFLGQARKELAVGRLPTGPPSPGGISKTAVGRLPTTSAARRAANPRPLSVDYRQVPPPTGRKISNHRRGGTRQTTPLTER